MIGILNSKLEAFKYVFGAFKRSFSDSQILELESLEDLEFKKVSALVLISPTEQQLGSAIAISCIKKLVILGTIPISYSDVFQFHLGDWPQGEWGKAPSADTYKFSESREIVEYTENSKRRFGCTYDRPLERFDFMDEWNNLGYGAIKTTNDIWSLSFPAIFDQKNVLSNINKDGELICSYSSFIELEDKFCLWFNREVGPVDSYEWQIIEYYLSSIPVDGGNCYPVLLEVPTGFDCAITMRLDCDEDIESSRYLWNAYREESIPFSLAIHTKNLSDERHFPIMRELDLAGEAILSHTATHAPNWGGSYESALSEAKISADLIESVINKRVVYAVSPFHHTPIYALKALNDAGYKGCIGGIIKNDPEFLTFNGGNLADLPDSFIGHSQQVMLHGDCILDDGGDSIRIYKKSFDISKKTNTIFGYLDHPFSDRYQYGWESEKQRKDVHFELIDYIRSNSNTPCFMNEVDAMNFLQDKEKLYPIIANGVPTLALKKGYIRQSLFIPKVMYKGVVFDGAIRD
ncbi:polysaccharide deacetylase [Vibrio maerlii]|uniref:polysaccharide deacetylase n=1 Tax=Vibrio maerlii TaxID=2231648 RepID=UPI000E3E6617|nr:polysaccharide deacetylase [Vibrio maerlii]